MRLGLVCPHFQLRGQGTAHPVVDDSVNPKSSLGASLRLPPAPRPPPPFLLRLGGPPGSAASHREAPPGPRDPRDGGVCVRFEASRDILAGEELLIDYSERWWEAKGERPA